MMKKIYFRMTIFITNSGNIFNQSILTSKILNFVNNGGNLLVRSIFLQGLILMDIDNILVTYLPSKSSKNFKNYLKSWYYQKN